MSEQLDYKSAGLDLDVYDDTIDRIGRLVKKTHGPGVIDGFGGFASLFALDVNRWLFSGGYRKPVLVTCTDGVGTKLKIASMMRKFDTVGIDLVAMSVNDCLCCGAQPLVFLDYLAMPKDDPTLAEELVKGMVAGCQQAGCALTGGETAILPDFYAPGDFDMAGFAVGAVEREDAIDGSHIQAGDIVLGLASTGLHSNGYSLARKIIFEHAKLSVNDHVAELGKSVGEELLTPTRIYVEPVQGCSGIIRLRKSRSWNGSHHRRRNCRQRPTGLSCQSASLYSPWQLADPACFLVAATAGECIRGRDGPRVQLRHRLRDDCVALLRREHSRTFDERGHSDLRHRRSSRGSAGVEWIA